MLRFVLATEAGVVTSGFKEGWEIMYLINIFWTRCQEGRTVMGRHDFMRERNSVTSSLLTYDLCPPLLLDPARNSNGMLETTAH